MHESNKILYVNMYKIVPGGKKDLKLKQELGIINAERGSYISDFSCNKFPN